jgi:hypothetical protein
VPTLVELVVPLKPFTRVVDVLGGVTKSERSLEIQAVAPPSTRPVVRDRRVGARNSGGNCSQSKQACCSTLRGPASATPPQEFPFNEEILNELEDDVKYANRLWKPSHSLVRDWLWISLSASRKAARASSHPYAQCNTVCSLVNRGIKPIEATIKVGRWALCTRYIWGNRGDRRRPVKNPQRSFNA